MKKILLICSLLITVAGFGQGTYYWVGGPTGNWTSSASWNTNLDGSGTARTVTSGQDRLVIDGTNIGGAIASTGMVTPTITGTSNFGALALQNNALLTLQRSGSTGTSTYTINGDNQPADDLMIDATSSLTIANTVASTNFVLQVGTAGALLATGRIFGTVNISGSVSSRLVCMNQR